MANQVRRSGRMARRLVGALVVVLVLVAAGAVAGLVLSDRYRLPEQDLFGGAPSPTRSPTPPPGADITGPLDLLLVGIDPRPDQPEWIPNADAVLVLHVNARLTRGYLFSLPRDLLVDVPAFEPAGFGGERTKLTHAMSRGSRVPGQDLPDRAQGFALLAETVSDYTGIERFDAGAVLNFAGFTDLVDAVGGLDGFYVDQPVASQHRQPDGSHRPLQPGGGGYLGPRKTYEVGEQDLAGWEALDYARQRYIDGADYARQRHHRQLIQALVQEVFAQDLMTDPAGLDRVVRAVGDALVFDGRGQRLIDFGYALRRLHGDRIALVGLPGSSVISGGGYQGEQLDPVAEDFFAAVREDQVAGFLADHPELRDEPPPARSG